MFKKHSVVIAFQVDIARQMETPGTLRRIIDAGAEMGYNDLFLYGEGSLQYKTHPACSAPWGLTQKDFLQLQNYARTQHSMNLVPVIPVLGHASYALKNRELAGMREVKHPVFIRPHGIPPHVVGYDLPPPQQPRQPLVPGRCGQGLFGDRDHRD